MITKDEIDQKAAQYGITPQSVEKDYVFGRFLHAIYTQSELANAFILKGGNALRKAYLEETRFSQDLDFSIEQGLDSSILRREIGNICQYVGARTGIVFEPEKTAIKDKRLPQELASDVLEARIYFRGFYGEENISLKAQLDITQFDQLFLPVQQRNLIHPYSDSSECSAIIQCQKAEEILASKFICLLHRGKPVDLYDLAKMLVVHNPYNANRLEVIRTFLSKSVYQADYNTAKRQLQEVSLDKYKPFWSQFTVPTTFAIAFETIVAAFPALIDNLFSLVVPLASALPTVLAPQRSRGSAWGGYTSGYSYFRSDYRNTIISSGRTQTMIELLYDGARRLVEPYKLEYYVRKKDGRGSEYFWGYDTTGGNSGKVTIKMFFCEKIQSVRETNISFTPRYAIEL